VGCRWGAAAVFTAAGACRRPAALPDLQAMPAQMHVITQQITPITTMIVTKKDVASSTRLSTPSLQPLGATLAEEASAGTTT